MTHEKLAREARVRCIHSTDVCEACCATAIEQAVAEVPHDEALRGDVRRLEMEVQTLTDLRALENKVFTKTAAAAQARVERLNKVLHAAVSYVLSQGVIRHGDVHIPVAVVPLKLAILAYDTAALSALNEEPT